MCSLVTIYNLIKHFSTGKFEVNKSTGRKRTVATSYNINKIGMKKTDRQTERITQLNRETVRIIIKKEL